MQQTTTVTAVPMQTTGVVVAPTVPQTRLNVSAIRGLGITQIVFGVLSIILGIVATAALPYGYWVNASGSGIWFGLWILVSGIIGVFSARQPESKALNGCNMGFNITSTVLSFFVGIFMAVGLGYYNTCSYQYYRGWNTWGNNGYYDYDLHCDNKSAGIAVYAVLVIIMTAEFFVSLVISIYCCQGTGCCGAQSSGVIIQQHPGYGQTIITSNASYPATTMAYPPGSVPGYAPTSAPGYPPMSAPGYAPTSAPGYAPGYPSASGQYPVQQHGYVAQAPMAAGVQTSTTYSVDQQKVAPPPYSG